MPHISRHPIRVGNCLLQHSKSSKNGNFIGEDGFVA